MNWTLVGVVTGGCLLFTLYWQNQAIDRYKDSLAVEQDKSAGLQRDKDQLFKRLEDINALGRRLDAFDEDQKKRTAGLKKSLAATLAESGCARDPVPPDTRELQRQDVDRANTEIRAMFTP